MSKNSDSPYFQEGYIIQTKPCHEWEIYLNRYKEQGYTVYIHDVRIHEKKDTEAFALCTIAVEVYPPVKKELPKNKLKMN